MGTRPHVPVEIAFQNAVLDCSGAFSALRFSPGVAEAVGRWQPCCHREGKARLRMNVTQKTGTWRGRGTIRRVLL